MIRTIILAAATVLCVALPVSVPAQLAGEFKTITLDGSLADWSNPGDVLYTDSEIADGAPANSSYESVYVANNATNLYLGLDTKGTGGGTINNTWTHHVYLDTDMNAGTGFDSGWMIHGYDRMIQYGGGGGSYSVFEFTGASQATWSWNFIGLIDYGSNDDIAELSIPLSLLGMSGNSLVMEINVTGPGVTTQTWASQYETGAETYTLAQTPPPPPTIDGTNLTYTATPDLIFNPERGIYYTGSLAPGTDFNNIRAQGVSLCYANLLLDDFRTSSISAARLQEIKDAFSAMRDVGLKGVLRITYDNSSSGIDTTLAWMETHLQQLQPILEDNSELLAFIQAGMIGAWGEWHSSSNGLDTPAGRAAVYDLLCTYMPTNTFIQVRTPAFANELVNLDTNPLDDSTAFTGTPRARIGHHNDAWISSATDLGTYPSDPVAREALKAQIESHTKYAPWGGESAVLDTNFTQYASVLAEAERFHATYLNADYNPDVIAELIANGSWDVIQKKLGHRFELISATLPESLVAGSEFSYDIRLQNSGWAPLYNARPVILRVLSGSVVIQEIELPADPRFWRPEAGEIVLAGSAHALGSIAPQHLGFALWLPDAAPELKIKTDYAVRFANENVWDSTQGHNLLMTPVSEPVIAGSFITVDGPLSEWGPGDIFYADAEITDGFPKQSSYTSVYLTNDAVNLYIGLQTKSNGGGSISNTWTHTIYLDSDMNAGTGYNAGWMTHGYDYRIRYGAGGHLFYAGEFTGATQADNEWIPRAAIAYADDNRTAELAVPLSALGIAAGDPVVVQLNVHGTGVTTATWAHQSEASAKTYTPGAAGSANITSQLIEYDAVTNNIRMAWNGPTNAVLEIDVSPDLEAWEFLGRGISDGSGNLLVIDHPPAAEQERFYRVKR